MPEGASPRTAGLRRSAVVVVRALPGTGVLSRPARAVARVAGSRPAGRAGAPAPRPAHDLAWRASILVCATAGALILTATYGFAARHPTDGPVYARFWLGFLLVLVPCALRLIAPGTPRAERLTLVAMLAILNFLPKYLRDPSGPLFHDELLHLRQAEVIHDVGAPFQPSAVAIYASYPGLHLVTDMLHDVTGTPMWTTAIVLLAVTRVAVLVAVFLLAERITGSSVVGGVAALIYSLNPSSMYFHSQYSYESLGVLLFMWVLVAAARIHDAGDARTERHWLLVGAVVGTACVVTHHVTTYCLLIALSACAVASSLGRRHAGDAAPIRLWGLLAALLGAAAAWLIFNASGTYDYISYHVVAGVNQVADLFKSGQGNHRLFSHSTVPGYETNAAFLTPPIMAIGALAGVVRMWRKRDVGVLAVGIGAFGLLYFASLPFMLSVAGNEGARRSWGFTYLGLAILVAPVVAALVTWARHRGAVLRLAVGGALLAGICVVEVGNVAAGINETYRFPGPFLYGSDTRSQTPEARAAARWFEDEHGRGRLVATDRYMGLVFFGAGHQNTETLQSTDARWRLLVQPRAPSPGLMAVLHAFGYDYIVVDKRMTHALPREGIYLESGEPMAFQRTRPAPARAVTKFERLPWATKIYESDSLVLYAVDYRAVRTLPAGRVR